MTHQLGATPAVRTIASTAVDRLPFAVRLDRHDDPAAPAPAAPAAPAPAAPAPEASDDGAGDDPKLGPAGEKALAAMKERTKAAEAALKAAEAAKQAAEAKVQEFEDRDKTELEKATAIAERATAEASQAKAELVRQRVINETGLTVDLAEFLPSGDEATVRAAADKLKAALGNQATPKAGPRPDPSQGGGRTGAPVDWRTASREDFRAAVADLGIRTIR